jgi:hypothetical protein
MSFTWTSITSLETKAIAGHMNEVQTNINTLTDGLGVSRYTWAQLPVTSLISQIRAPQITELQQAVNYADSQNICVTKNVTQDIGILASNDVSVDSVRDTGVDNSQNATVYSGRDITYDSGVDITVDNPRYSTNYPGRDVAVYSTQCSPADASQWSAADEALDSYALLTNWSTANWATYNGG